MREGREEDEGGEDEGKDRKRRGRWVSHQFFFRIVIVHSLHA